MKQLQQLISAVTLLILASAAIAQVAGAESTTGNLVYTTVNPAPTGTNIGSNWSGFAIVNSTGGNTTGDNGAVTGYNPSTGVFMFGYNQGTIAYTYAINQALANSGSGIQVQGYNWSWEINNNNFDNRQPSTDTLTARILTFSPDNVTIRRTDTWTYNTRFDWTTFSGTVNYNVPGAPSEFGNMRIEFSGRDVGFWAGYYGPQVRNIDVRLRYGVDPCVTNPQSSPTCPGFKTFYNIGDDGYAIVPIPFGFPLYGQTLTHSIFFSNGAVSFYSPTQPQRWGGGSFGGVNVDGNLPASYFYTIMPLNTDLINYHGAFYTQGNNNQLKYTWENISQFGRPDSSNTFSLEIRPTGYIGLQYSQIDIQGGWSSGIVGNAGLGEFITFNAATGSAFSVPETVATDCSNPLVNVNCPGYAQAFLQQQCTIRSNIYPGCPNYVTELALCDANPLRNTYCPDFTTAQSICNFNQLSRSFCPLYQNTLDTTCANSPIENNLCPGYQLAFNCSNDPLYATQCPGYAEAYALKYIVNSPSTTTTAVEEPVTQTATAAEEKTVTAATETAAPAATAKPAEPAAPVQLVAAAPAAAQSAAAAAPPARTEPAAAAPARTTRQAMAEQRQAAAREAAAKSAQDNPGAASAEMDAADSLEKQVEIQNVVLGAIGFVAGFDAYGRVTLPDGVGYAPFVIYPGQRNIDTPAARGLIGRSDRIHEEMVNEQYR